MIGNRKTAKKRIGSLLLAACIALTLLPCAVLAVGADQIKIYKGSFSNLIIPASNESNVHPADTTWKLLDPAVATVDAAGKVTAVAQGLVIMEGTANGETKQIYVRVKG